MVEKDYQVPFGVILNASNAKEKFLLAIREARKGDFEKADELMEAGCEDLKEAHKVQTEIIQSEARGENIELSVIFVHSQDHLTMALTIRELAEEMIDGYRLFYSKEKK